MTALTIETESAGAYADATEADLHRIVSQLSPESSYVILHREGNELYAQAALARSSDGAITDGFVVEYAVADSDLRQTSVATTDRVYELLSGWAFDRPGWKDSQEWSILQF